MYTFICDALFLYHNKRVNRTCRRVQGSEREKRRCQRKGSEGISFVSELQVKNKLYLYL